MNKDDSKLNGNTDEIPVDKQDIAMVADLIEVIDDVHDLITGNQDSKQKDVKQRKSRLLWLTSLCSCISKQSLNCEICGDPCICVAPVKKPTKCRTISADVDAIITSEYEIAEKKCHEELMLKKHELNQKRDIFKAECEAERLANKKADEKHAEQQAEQQAKKHAEKHAEQQAEQQSEQQAEQQSEQQAEQQSEQQYENQVNYSYDEECEKFRLEYSYKCEKLREKLDTEYNNVTINIGKTPRQLRHKPE
jgi:hypothetical protein